MSGDPGDEHRPPSTREVLASAPAEVLEVVDTLARNPNLQGAFLQVNEIGPGVFEIVALHRVCVLCARKIEAPHGPMTQLNPGAPGRPTVMPHACGECIAGAVKSLGGNEIKGGEA